MRYRLEYHPNENCLSIHIDKVLTTEMIERFKNEDCDKDKQALFVQEIYKTVPGIQCISLCRYEIGLEKRVGIGNSLGLEKGVVFSWEEITGKVLAILKKHLDPETELKEIAPPLKYSLDPLGFRIDINDNDFIDISDDPLFDDR